MKLNFSFCLFAIIAACNPSETYAGCGLLRRGGCSDPCTVAACTGVAFHQSSCGGCARMSDERARGSGDGKSAACYPQTAQVHQAMRLNYVPSSYINNAEVLIPQPAAPSQFAINAATIQRSDLVDCGPVVSYQVLLQPEYSTQTQQVPYIEYKDEVRYRTRTISRQVPVEVQDFRTKTVLVPTTETKTVEYSVLVPRVQDKTIEIVESVPVWNEIAENYTVKVPTVVEVPEEYPVRVATLRDENFTYTVQVPQAQTQQRIQRVVNAVPVTKTRTIQVTRPVTRSQMLTRDHGHWEMRVEEIAGISAPHGSSNALLAIGGCGTGTMVIDHNPGCDQSFGYNSCGHGSKSKGCGCRRSPAGSNCCGNGCKSFCASSGVVGDGCSPVAHCGSISGTSIDGGACNPGSAIQTVTRRVWVPKIVTEEVPVIENIAHSQELTYTAFEQQTTEVPFEYTTVVYVPEQRTGTRKAVEYTNETRTRTRKVVQYNEETRTRTRKELSYKQETRSQTIPSISYTPEKRTKVVSYTVNVPQTQVEPITTTRFDLVQEELTEQHTVRVPIQSFRDQQVQVCRMIPKLVPVTINPCQDAVVQSNVVDGLSIGAGYNSAPANANCGPCGVPTLAPPQCDCP
jgi:hypothetical protein